MRPFGRIFYLYGFVYLIVWFAYFCTNCFSIFSNCCFNFCACVSENSCSGAQLIVFIILLRSDINSWRNNICNVCSDLFGWWLYVSIARFIALLRAINVCSPM